MLSNERARLHAKPNVRAVWTGRDGRIRVGVDRKVPRQKLVETDLVPRQVEGRKTDVVALGPVTPRIVPASSPDGVELGPRELKQRRRPCPGGFSCGHHQITAGTLGCWVKDADGNWVILSNNHVLANSNEATIGDRITQPGPFDLEGVTTDPTNWIGHLQEFVIIGHEGGGLPGGCSIPGAGKLIGKGKPRAGLEQPFPNRVDAAIAKPFGTAIEPEIHSIGFPSGMRAPVVGEAVMKSGRTTEFTTDDQIEAIDLSVQVGYGSFTALFEQQLLLISEPGQPFSQPGDSGSAWIARSDEAMVGLLFAGGQLEDGRDATIASNILDVQELLGVSL